MVHMCLCNGKSRELKGLKEWFYKTFTMLNAHMG
jgi:hypothetical protein